MTIIEELLKIWSKTYYMEVLVLISALFLLLKSINNKSKTFPNKLFGIFALTALCIFFIADFIKIYVPVKTRINTIIIEGLNTIFALIEFLIFSYYLITIINSKKFKKIIIISNIIFLILVIFFFVKVFDPLFINKKLLTLSIFINIVEFLFLLLALFCFFFELFEKDPTENIANSDAFWISSALFIYCVTSLPMLLLSESLNNFKFLHDLLFSLHYTTLSILLLTISKFFTWKKAIPT